MGASGDKAARPAVRGDVDGLRAIAIVLVVAFHVGLGGFSGGFIGVDVFFVISGFLITRNMLRETDGSGRIALLAFWGRRIRRLVPALGLMVLVVMGLSLWLQSPAAAHNAAIDGRAAALYVSNILFANQATNYFAPDINKSLFLHTWSLGVEEQFYLLWPLLVGAACLAVRRRRHLLRPVLTGVFAVTLVASLTTCVVLTRTNTSDAFYLLPSRAWEFAAAGLLAALRLPAVFGRRAVQLGAALIGLALLFWGTVALSTATLYPGLWATIPVVGTLLLIAAGGRGATTGHATTNPVSTTMAVRPMQWLGRVSYSWYLWHWPFILLAVDVWDHDTVPVRTTAAVAALGVAAVAHHFVENPVRFGAFFTTSRPRTYVMGGAATALVFFSTFGIAQASTNEVSTIGYKAQVAEYQNGKPPYPCPHDVKSRTGIAYCNAGDITSKRVVFLAGDSHTGMWMHAFGAAATAEKVRLVVRWHANCPAIAVDPTPVHGPGQTDECHAYRADTQKLIAELRPQAMILSTASHYRGYLLDGRALTRREVGPAWETAFQTYVTGLRRQGIAVGSVVDTPAVIDDPIDCLSSHPTPAPCNPTRYDALRQGNNVRDAERDARAAIGGVPTMDVTDVICGHQICSVVIAGLVVYYDRAHLTDRWSLTQLGRIRPFLRQTLAAT